MAAAASARKPVRLLADAMEGVQGEYRDVLTHLSEEGLYDYYMAFEEVVVEELDDFWPRYNSLSEKQTRELATDEQTARTDAFVYMVAEIFRRIMNKSPKKMVDRLNKLCEQYEHSSDPKFSMLKKFCHAKSWPATKKGLNVVNKLIAVANARVEHNQRMAAERVRDSELAAAEAERVRASELAAAAAAATAAAEQKALEISFPNAEDRRHFLELMAQRAQLEQLEEQQKRRDSNKGGKRRNKSHKKRSYRKRSHRKRMSH